MALCNWAWCLLSYIKLTHAPFAFKVVFQVWDLMFYWKILIEAIMLALIVAVSFSFWRIHTLLFFWIHSIPSYSPLENDCIFTNTPSPSKCGLLFVVVVFFHIMCMFCFSLWLWLSIKMLSFFCCVSINFMNILNSWFDLSQFTSRQCTHTGSLSCFPQLFQSPFLLYIYFSCFLFSDIGEVFRL